MNLYNFHSKSEDLKGHHEKDELEPNSLSKLIRGKAFTPKTPLPDYIIERIARSPRLAYEYASFIKKGPWPEGEDAIAKDASYSYMYAYDILKKHRFPKGEKIMMQVAEFAVSYAQHILDNRWKAAEPYILKDTDNAIYYAIEFFVNGRWPELEKSLLNNLNVDNLIEYSERIYDGKWNKAVEALMNSGDNEKLKQYLEYFE